MLVDNSNYEYRGSLRPDDILNDIGARGMELGILKKYQIRIPFNIEAIPVEKFELEHKNAQRVGDRYIKTAPSIATIKIDGSKGVKPNINVNVNIRMYNFDDIQCTVIPSAAYGFVTGMNLQLC